MVEIVNPAMSDPRSSRRFLISQLESKDRNLYEPLKAIILRFASKYLLHRREPRGRVFDAVGEYPPPSHLPIASEFPSAKRGRDLARQLDGRHECARTATEFRRDGQLSLCDGRGRIQQFRLSQRGSCQDIARSVMLVCQSSLSLFSYAMSIYLFDCEMLIEIVVVASPHDGYRSSLSCAHT